MLETEFFIKNLILTKFEEKVGHPYSTKCKDEQKIIASKTTQNFRLPSKPLIKFELTWLNTDPEFQFFTVSPNVGVGINAELFEVVTLNSLAANSDSVTARKKWEKLLKLFIKLYE